MIFPDDFDYKEEVPEPMRSDLENFSFETIWSIYNQFKYGRVVEVPKDDEWKDAPSQKRSPEMKAKIGRKTPVNKNR